MTTAKSPQEPAVRHWEPYPELPQRRKDMQQIRPTDYLQDIFLSVLTPGYSYKDHPTILIGREIPIYYDPTAPVTGASGPPPHVIPDCMVAFDVDTDAIWRRVGYDPVQNSKPPDLVVEVASRRTYRNDMLRKRDVYQQIGVPEYWRFDPFGGRYYGQPIIGEGLVDGRYQRFPTVEYDSGIVGVTSILLSLNFRWDGLRFWAHDPATGEELEHWQQAQARLTERNTSLTERNTSLTERNTSLTERNTSLTERNARLTERNARLTAGKDRLEAENARLLAEVQRLREERGDDTSGATHP